MRDFACPRCGARLAFENSLCLACGSEVGLELGQRTFVLIGTSLNDSTPRNRCANSVLAVCNWVVPASSSSGLCESCELTRTRPSDQDLIGLSEFAQAEAAKRRLVYELAELGLPLAPKQGDDEGGVAFDLLSSRNADVVTGHDAGVITLDLAESEDPHREQLRESMDEPYRTVLGHFRHEIGHYYFTVLITDSSTRTTFEQLFGDPDADYQAALDRHYQYGPPADWSATFISAYATMHPAEDWAECFAHYLHIRDTLDTATAFGITSTPARLTDQFGDFDEIVELWIPVTWTLNMVNRSMGHADLYPFVIPPSAIEKLRFIHQLVGNARSISQDTTLGRAGIQATA